MPTHPVREALGSLVVALGLAACGGGAETMPAAAGGDRPPAAPVAPGAPTLDVMSYNMHWGGPSGSRLPTVTDIIAESGADLVGLQEVRRFARVQEGGDFGCQDQPALLAEMLEARTGDPWGFAFAANDSGPQSPLHCESVTSEPRAEGVAVLSRYPITSRVAHRLPHERGAAEARVDAPGGAVTVFSVHLDGGSHARRLDQARAMARLVGARGGVVFLAGDLNGQPDSEEVRVLLGVARDAWAEGGRGDGRTRSGRIDYVLVRGPATVVSAEVVRRTVSDHRPVVARFAR